MGFDLDSEPELAPVPRVVSASRAQYAAWDAAARAAGFPDTHDWAVRALDAAAGNVVAARAYADTAPGRLVGAERGRL